MRLFNISKLFSRVHVFTFVLKTPKQNFCRLTMSGDCKPSVFFILGAPGSGKGTQCSHITEKFNFEHLSAGDLLRAEKNTPGSPYGSLIEEHIKNGSIVPAQITVSLLERGMHSSKKNYFLIDGFPRNRENVEVWEKNMSGKVNILGVLFFDCDEDVCVKRCLLRGAAGSGRSDDNEESLRKRFVTYKKDTMGVVRYYGDQHLVYSIDSDRSPEDIFNDVQILISKIAPLSVKQ